MKLLFSILLVFFLTSCQTIENKADNIGKKEIKEKETSLGQSFNAKSKTDKEGFERKIEDLDKKIEQKRIGINKFNSPH